jgi:hypothetical protein
LRLETRAEHAARELICSGEVLERAVVVPEARVQLGERQCDVHCRPSTRVPATLLRPLCQSHSAVHRRLKCPRGRGAESACAGMVGGTRREAVQSFRVTPLFGVLMSLIGVVWLVVGVADLAR